MIPLRFCDAIKGILFTGPHPHKKLLGLPLRIEFEKSRQLGLEKFFIKLDGRIAVAGEHHWPRRGSRRRWRWGRRVSCATANHAWHLHHRHPICAAFIPSLIGRQDLAALQILARFLKGIRPESLPIPIEMQQHAGILRRERGDGKWKQPANTLPTNQLSIDSPRLF